MPDILAIESTCDETAAAVVADHFRVRSNVVATQIDLHAKYRGVVPEIASRAHIENILPVIRRALDEASGETGRLQSGAPVINRPAAVAVAYRPGLIGSLLVGVTAAKTLAWSWNLPLIGVDHVHAHLHSVRLDSDADPPMPAVGLVCSGGHTALYKLESWTDVGLIGSTIDDAVGEAYDKVAAILGLGYPGGPVIDRLAAGGDPAAVRFPRSTLGRESLDFSFSGLKTAVLYHVRGVPTRNGPDVRLSHHEHPDVSKAPSGQALADLCASFQQACIDVLLTKLRRAVKRVGARSVLVGGGVSANAGLRAALASLGIPVFVPPLKYCTDNAAMIGGLAQVYLQSGQFSDLTLDAVTYSQFAT